MHASAPPGLPAVDDLVDGRYRIVALLGQGGMGAVYLAEQVALRREVALKVLGQSLAHDDASARRFEREARAASRIRHPNVVEVYDFGKLPSGCFYYVMERLEGEDLSRLLARGRMPWLRAQGLLVQLVRALAAAHQQGIVHRDIKPSNCFLVAPRRSGDPDLIKLLDFGIAKTDGGAGETVALTGAADVVGTALYMAPEQAMGRPVDARTDVYALGVVMFEMLTGKVPFSAPTGVQVLVLHAQQPPPPPRTIEPGISPVVEGIILRALAKDPGARFQSMEELEAALVAVGPEGEALGPSPAATIRLVGGASAVAGTEVFAPIADTALASTAAITPRPGSASSQAIARTEVLGAVSSTTSVLDARGPDSGIVVNASTGVASSSPIVIDERASTGVGVSESAVRLPPITTAAPRRRSSWAAVAILAAGVSVGSGYAFVEILDRGTQRVEDEGASTPDGREAPERAASEPLEAEETRELAEREGEGLALPLHVEPELAKRTEPSRPKTAVEQIAALAREGVLPPRAWLAAPGAFAGRVVGAGPDAAPIDGARVCAWMLDPAAPSELRRVPTCARSDRHGEYTLKALPPSYYALTASAEGFAPGQHGSEVLVLTPGQSRAELDLVLHRGGSKLVGHVRDQAGKALRGASVHVGTAERPIAQTVTDDRGAFAVWVDGGRHRVGAAAKRHRPTTLEEASSRAPIELVLVREAVWEGRIVWQDTEAPVSGVGVRVGDELAYSDSKGRVRIGGLAAGRHDARIDVPGASEHVTTSLALDPGRTLVATIRVPRAIVPEPEPEATPAPNPAPTPAPLPEPAAASASLPTKKQPPTDAELEKKLARKIKAACAPELEGQAVTVLFEVTRSGEVRHLTAEQRNAAGACAKRQIVGARFRPRERAKSFEIEVE